MATKDGPIRLLQIEDEAMDAEAVRRFLAQAAPQAFAMTHVETLAEARAALAAQPFDIVLLDLNLPDTVDGETYRAVAAFPEVPPIVVMTGGGSEEAGQSLVAAGAQDYLVKGAFDASLLVRVLRHAIERAGLVAARDQARRDAELARAGELRERERRLFAEGSRADGTDADGTQAAKAAHLAGNDFNEVVRHYEQLLDLAIERRIYRGQDKPLTDGLRHLAADLAKRKATPREMVEIHSQALKHRLQTAASVAPKTQAYLDEGRLLLIELLGYVIAYFRDPSGFLQSMGGESRSP